MRIEFLTPSNIPARVDAEPEELNALSAPLREMLFSPAGSGAVTIDIEADPFDTSVPREFSQFAEAASEVQDDVADDFDSGAFLMPAIRALEAAQAEGIAPEMETPFYRLTGEQADTVERLWLCSDITFVDSLEKKLAHRPLFESEALDLTPAEAASIVEALHHRRPREDAEALGVSFLQALDLVYPIYLDLRVAVEAMGDR